MDRAASGGPGVRGGVEHGPGDPRADQQDCGEHDPPQRRPAAPVLRWLRCGRARLTAAADPACRRLASASRLRARGVRSIAAESCTGFGTPRSRLEDVRTPAPADLATWEKRSRTRTPDAGRLNLHPEDRLRLPGPAWANPAHRARRAATSLLRSRRPRPSAAATCTRWGPGRDVAGCVHAGHRREAVVVDAQAALLRGLASERRREPARRAVRHRAERDLARDVATVRQSDRAELPVLARQPPPARRGSPRSASSRPARRSAASSWRPSITTTDRAQSSNPHANWSSSSLEPITATTRSRDSNPSQLGHVTMPPPKCSSKPSISGKSSRTPVARTTRKAIHVSPPATNENRSSSRSIDSTAAGTVTTSGYPARSARKRSRSSPGAVRSAPR